MSIYYEPFLKGVEGPKRTPKYTQNSMCKHAAYDACEEFHKLNCRF